MERQQAFALATQAVSGRSGSNPGGSGSGGGDSAAGCGSGGGASGSEGHAAGEAGQRPASRAGPAAQLAASLAACASPAAQEPADALQPPAALQPAATPRPVPAPKAAPEVPAVVQAPAQLAGIAAMQGVADAAAAVALGQPAAALHAAQLASYQQLLHALTPGAAVVLPIVAAPAPAPTALCMAPLAPAALATSVLLRHLPPLRLAGQHASPLLRPSHSKAAPALPSGSGPLAMTTMGPAAAGAEDQQPFTPSAFLREDAPSPSLAAPAAPAGAAAPASAASSLHAAAPPALQPEDGGPSMVSLVHAAFFAALLHDALAVLPDQHNCPAQQLCPGATLTLIHLQLPPCSGRPRRRTSGGARLSRGCRLSTRWAGSLSSGMG